MQSRLTLNQETLHCLTAQPQSGAPGGHAQANAGEGGHEGNKNASLTTWITLTWD